METPVERRKYPRLRREERAVLRPVENAEEDPARAALYCKTVDISPTGMQVRSKKELHSGESVEVVISVEGYGSAFHLHGQTRWCRPLDGEDEYLVGVELAAANGSDFASWQRIFN